MTTGGAAPELARMAASAGQMLLDGERTSGQDVRTANVTAAMAIANIVKSSLGPVGLDKMLVREWWACGPVGV